MGKGAPLRRLIEKSSIPHCFFWGPPGSGKTTLAKIIAKKIDSPFYALNATDLKVEELRAIFKSHKNALEKPLIFIDEVHRLAKNQQEVLLPIMENREALIIGASTENPFFSLTAAIRSRSMLFEFKPLNLVELEKILEMAYNHTPFEIEENAKEYLLKSSGGDARAMLNLLDACITIDEPISLELLKSLRPSSLNDGSSESQVHYDLASALIKSIRGSDPDAAIYYLARLIKGGENPEFIARRLSILASEDIGNANPNALVLANSSRESVAKIGYPEARIILSQLTLYLCASPKSNSAYIAIDKAIKLIEDGEILEVPQNIKQQNRGYLYPHDFGGWVNQKYLAKPLKIVEWKPIGFEKTLMEWLLKLHGAHEPK